MKHWKERYSAGGVCDFRQNYDFYFRWLLNKVASCFVINGLPESVDQTYLKTELILTGACCMTDFGGKLYACAGALGGKPNEYYIPTEFIIANPILGSKSVRFSGEDKNGVVIWNTETDKLYAGQSWYSAGLYQHINQTATLLADNIISINANQINSRVSTFFTADSEAQAASGETILKQMYAGRPYQILRADLIEKININPVATASTSSNITELVELNNYIISNFMQSIGIKANNLRKRERMITGEIESQNDYLELSALEMLASWQKGLDETSELYKEILNGGRLTVSLNPAIIDLVADQEEEPETKPAESEAAQQTEQPEELPAESTEEMPADEPEQEEQPDQVAEELESKAEIVEIVARAAAGEGEENENMQPVEGGEVASDTISERENDA